MWFATSRKSRRPVPFRHSSSARPWVEALEDRCLLSGPGTLDPTFGSGGIVTTTVGTSSAGQVVALQPDGKILAAGNSDGHLGVVRYNADGSFDTTFGSGGKVITTNAPAWAVALYPNAGNANDGKIVLPGADFSLCRLNSNGSLDTTFGSGGTVPDPFGGGDYGDAVALQPDGKIIVGGSTGGGTGPWPGSTPTARWTPPSATAARS